MRHSTQHSITPPRLLKGGFSLLELILVLMLMGILLVIAAPRWPEALLLAAQAERLAQDIRYAQALTMNREQSYTIRGLGGSAYTLEDDTGTPVLPEPEPLSGVTVEPFSFSFTTTLGAPNAAYTPIRLTMGSESLTLTVTALTGTVVIQP